MLTHPSGLDPPRICLRTSARVYRSISASVMSFVCGSSWVERTPPMSAMASARHPRPDRFDHTVTGQLRFAGTRNGAFYGAYNGPGIVGKPSRRTLTSPRLCGHVLQAAGFVVKSLAHPLQSTRPTHRPIGTTNTG